MPLTDLTWQLGSGPLLNSDSTGVPFVDISRVSGLDNAPFRETVRDHEGIDGGFIDAEFETGRDISLEGTVYANVETAEEYLDLLKENFAPVQTPIPLVFKVPGKAERVLFVKSRGVRYDWESARRVGMTPIQFLMYAEDPRIYDNNLISQIIPFGGTATTGYAFSYGFDLSFGATVPPDGQFVVNVGNRPTPAILTITGPVLNPRIVNDTAGKTLAFTIDLLAGETLVIDLANNTVMLNGTVNRRSTLDESNWFLFPKGSTFIRFGGATGSGTLTISYRNAWR